MTLRRTMYTNVKLVQICFSLAHMLFNVMLLFIIILRVSEFDSRSVPHLVIRESYFFFLSIFDISLPL